MSIEKYRYLWDGTEDGWALQEINRTSWNLIFLFEVTGPTTEQITKLRKLLPELQSISSTEAFRLLKGKLKVESNVIFSNIAIQQIKRQAEAMALNFEVNACEQKSYLPTRNGIQVLVIENEELANQVVFNMKRAGVKIVESYVD